MKNNFFFFIVLLLLVGCKPNSINAECNDFSKKVAELLIEVGIEGSCTCMLEENKLNLRVDNAEEYFLENDDINLINALMLYRLNLSKAKFDTVNIIHFFEGIIDGVQIEYNKSSIEQIYNMMNSNPKYFDLVTFSFREFNHLDIIGLNHSIDVMKENFDDFKNSSDYWDVLFNFQRDCCNSDSESFQDFQKLIISADFPKYKIKPEVLRKIKENCIAKCVREEGK